VLDEGNGDLVFTWNSDVKDEEGNPQVTRIAISELCDVYTAKVNDWIQLDGFEFSHKTKTGLPTESKGSVVFSQTTTDSVINAAEDSVEIKVPTITVDAAGHVTALTETIVGISLPASIATAVQTVTAAQTEVLSNTKFVAVKATRAQDSNDVVLATEYKTQAVADATTDADGLATALNVRTYVDAQVGNVNTAIENLDGTATIATAANGVVTLKAGIVETNGIIANNTEADITLAKIATTGAAADVTYTRGSGDNVTNMTVQAAISALEAVDTWDAGTY
jgi:hypothetical protein